jgi:hypothetical protein
LAGLLLNQRTLLENLWEKGGPKAPMLCIRRVRISEIRVIRGVF